jgi:glucokinase
MELIAGDIGGTKTKLALYDSDKGLKEPLFEATYTSVSYGSLEDIISRFIEDFGIEEIGYAVFGVAGPVIEEKVDVTNLPWVIDRSHIISAIGFRDMHLLNDLEAMAYSISHLGETDLFILNKGVAASQGPRAIIAPGTGLGEAYLTWDGSRYVAHPSEGGHTEFGPADETEIELLKYLLERFSHVSYELICSGMGVPNIYSFLKDRGYYDEPAWFAEKLAEADDMTAVILGTAVDKDVSCAIAKGTLRMFVSILGAEAGNQALKILATGGVYIGGGIPPRILSALSEGQFMESFLRKGRLSRVLRNMPVSVILNPRAGLVGAAVSGFETMGKKS